MLCYPTDFEGLLDWGRDEAMLANQLDKVKTSGQTRSSTCAQEMSINPLRVSFLERCFPEHDGESFLCCERGRRFFSSSSQKEKNGCKCD